jgi:hypothetical protein
LTAFLISENNLSSKSASVFNPAELAAAAVVGVGVAGAVGNTVEGAGAAPGVRILKAGSVDSEVAVGIEAEAGPGPPKLVVILAELLGDALTDLARCSVLEGVVLPPLEAIDDVGATRDVDTGDAEGNGTLADAEVLPPEGAGELIGGTDLGVAETLVVVDAAGVTEELSEDAEEAPVAKGSAGAEVAPLAAALNFEEGGNANGDAIFGSGNFCSNSIAFTLSETGIVPDVPLVSMT